MARSHPADPRGPSQEPGSTSVHPVQRPVAGLGVPTVFVSLLGEAESEALKEHKIRVSNSFTHPSLHPLSLCDRVSACAGHPGVLDGTHTHRTTERGTSPLEDEAAGG